MGLGTVLFYLIVGTIVGVLGKLLAPGDKDNIPWWLVIVCGIGGMLLGDVIYQAFDWVQGIVTVLTAMVLVMVASGVTGRRKA